MNYMALLKNMHVLYCLTGWPNSHSYILAGRELSAFNLIRTLSLVKTQKCDGEVTKQLKTEPRMEELFITKVSQLLNSTRIILSLNLLKRRSILQVPLLQNSLLTH